MDLLVPGVRELDLFPVAPIHEVQIIMLSELDKLAKENHKYFAAFAVMVV
jgi:hypothetical protein